MHELTKAQQRVVTALIRERDSITAIANKQIAEINLALDAAASAFVVQAGLEGVWIFNQEKPGGTIELKEKEETP